MGEIMLDTFNIFNNSYIFMGEIMLDTFNQYLPLRAGQVETQKTYRQFYLNQEGVPYGLVHLALY